MNVVIFLLILFLVILILTPISRWHWGVVYIKNQHGKMIYYFDKIFFLKRRQGEKILQTILQLEMHRGYGLADKGIQFYDYKYFSPLLERLVILTKQHGLPLYRYLPEIKKGLLTDVQIEKKILKEMQDGLFQFLMMSLMTWIFIFFAQAMIQKSPPMAILGIIFVGQLIGPIVFYLTGQYLKRKSFFCYQLLFGEVYVFRSLFEVGLPLSVVLKESQVMRGVFSQNKKFRSDYEHFQFLIDEIKKQGHLPEAELAQMLQRLWDKYEEALTVFRTRLAFIKFLHLALIYLPLYFLYLVSLFKIFVEL